MPNSTVPAAGIGLPLNIVPFPADRVRIPTSPEKDPWRRCATTALTLEQFEGIDAAQCDAVIGAMVRTDPTMLARMLERSADDIRFLSAALSTFITLDGQIATAADRVLAKGGI